MYKTAVLNCKNMTDKFHAAKNLALVCKNNLGSFFSFVNNRLKFNVTSASLRMDDETITNDHSMTHKIFSGSVFIVDHGFCSDVNNHVVG